MYATEQCLVSIELFFNQNNPFVRPTFYVICTLRLTQKQLLPFILKKLLFWLYIIRK